MGVFMKARAVFDEGPQAPDGHYFHSEDFEALALEAGFLFGKDIEKLVWSFPDRLTTRAPRT
jgi:hypothetical protein